jgi:hypothetical protein
MPFSKTLRQHKYFVGIESNRLQLSMDQPNTLRKKDEQQEACHQLRLAKTVAGEKCAHEANRCFTMSSRHSGEIF